MKCLHCQTENPEGVKFCGECGQLLQEELTCPKCGFKNPTNVKFCHDCGQSLAPAQAAPPPISTPSPLPTSFANGRYQVKKFLGEGGKKKVYLAHDTVLDRDVAFALIKTEKLDENSRTRIKREAQAMGRLGDHPNIVTVYDFGDHEGQPFIVEPLLPGGDVEGLIEKAPDHRLPLEKSLEIARSVSHGLEFAHSKGIIHRDLKPGNVWLSADGTAKIGDFGLAVAVDLSRLTQEGMMVGTVSYMPPEQAMGGKVTAKADLYSLGAMLYEMVTGRPPFVGDDSVAIIGQHINTPPVSPTWHRADLPPALETLIMQLLQKDPEKRPQSAAVVLQALESINTGKSVTEPDSTTAAPAENPIYRKVFVGREPELRQLQSAFDGAMSGQGALTMVMGEPGIGKTSLCEQLATYVTLRGGRTLVGHCYEEGSLSLPYLAFVEVLRSYVLSREVKDLRKELGTGAADMARIVSEIRERLKIRVRPAGEPEEERYRLLQAVSGFLTNAASIQPLLIVLEDLHNADKATLEMLTHVSRSLSGTRLLIVGTYRDVEVDRTHPLSAALTELRRASTYGRVVLRGLNADEVRRMLESVAGQNLPWGLAEEVHRQTEGNPLFVQEAVRYLAEDGLLTREHGRLKTTGDGPLQIRLPEGLRDVIGKRLSRLSQGCNRVLSVASVIGREFRLELLQKVGGLPDDELLNALEEARKVAVVEELSAVAGVVTYRFAHAFFRQTLYEEIIAPRRIRLHQQVGKALEELYAGRLEDHAAELAEHFSYSSDGADLAKAVSYGEMAAQRAMSVYAWSEASRLLEQALKVQEVLDPRDKSKRCQLTLALAHALYNSGEYVRILANELPQAFALAEDGNDSKSACRACSLAYFSLIATGGSARLAEPEGLPWAERANRHALPDTVERVLANTMLALVQQNTGHHDEAVTLVSRSIELARHLGDPVALWYIAGAGISAGTGSRNAGERLRLAEEMLQWPRGDVPFGAITFAFYTGTGVFFESGQRQGFERCVRELKELATRRGMASAPTVVFRLMYYEMIEALLDGRLEEGVAISQRLLELGEELGLTQAARVWVSQGGLRSMLYRGQAAPFLEARLEDLSDHAFPSQMAFNLANLGRDIEATEILNRLVARGDAGSPIPALEAAIMVGHREMAERVLKLMSGVHPKATATTFHTVIGRHLGAAAAMLGRYEEARAYYLEAIKVATEMRFRPEIALTRLQMAELLLEHYPKEKKEALELLDFAIKEFREMKMQPSLERALRHKEILKA